MARTIVVAVPQTDRLCGGNCSTPYVRNRKPCITIDVECIPTVGGAVVLSSMKFIFMWFSHVCYVLRLKQLPLGSEGCHNGPSSHVVGAGYDSVISLARLDQVPLITASGVSSSSVIAHVVASAAHRIVHVRSTKRGQRMVLMLVVAASMATWMRRLTKGADLVRI